MVPIPGPGSAVVVLLLTLDLDEEVLCAENVADTVLPVTGGDTTGEVIPESFELL